MEIRALENTTRCLLWARTWQKQGGFQSQKEVSHGNHWEIRRLCRGPHPANLCRPIKPADLSPGNPVLTTAWL